MKQCVVDAYLYFVKHSGEKSIFERVEKATKWNDRRTIQLDWLVKLYGNNIDIAEWKSNKKFMDSLIKCSCEWYWKG